MRAFSNGTEWEIWSHNWCHQCTKDELGVGNGLQCPILNSVLLTNEIPIEWEITDAEYGNQYECNGFEQK